MERLVYWHHFLVEDVKQVPCVIAQFICSNVETFRDRISFVNFGWALHLTPVADNKDIKIEKHTKKNTKIQKNKQECKNTRIPNAMIQIWYSALRHPFWLLLVAFLSIAAKATFWLRDAATKIILMTLCRNQLHIGSWHPQQVGWSCFLNHIQLHFNIIVFVCIKKIRQR